MSAPKVDLSRVQLHDMAKPGARGAWMVLAKALLKGLLIGAVLAALVAAVAAAVAVATTAPAHLPTKTAKVVV
jgi:Mg/Co/Ni transporter MgtE